MKRFTQLAAIVAVALGSAANASAWSVSIQDNYIGAAASSPIWEQADSINTGGNFDISSMNVSVQNGVLTVDIFSGYFANVGANGTQNGDLFISTNGWSPSGQAPYLFDNGANGEQWEFALVMDNRNGGVGSSGVASLYQIPSNGAIRDSDFFYANTGIDYRSGQEVQLNTTGLGALAQGAWSITDLAGSNDVLTFSIALSSLGITGNANLGFRSHQRCFFSGWEALARFAAGARRKSNDQIKSEKKAGHAPLFLFTASERS
jgi:hypothetical protein